MSAQERAHIQTVPVLQRVSEAVASVRNALEEVSALAGALPDRTDVERLLRAAHAAATACAAGNAGAERVAAALEGVGLEHPNAADLLCALANCADAAEQGRLGVQLVREALRALAPAPAALRS